MADRSSAYLFAQIFELLASDCSKEQIARALWKEAFRYDFSPDQLAADQSLVALGLAHYTEDGITYKGQR